MVLRYGAVTTFCAIVLVLVVVTGNQVLSVDGPGRILYLIHDTIWLPLHGRFWTAVFPDTLIWLVALVGLVALVLVEFLGIASPLRGAQVVLLRRMLPSFPAPVLAMHGALRVAGLRAGLAEQVLCDMREDALHPFTVPGVVASDADFRRLCHLQRLQVAFGLQSPRDRVAVADVLGLAAVQPGARDDAAAPLCRAASALSPEAVPFWSDMIDKASFVPDLAAVLQSTVELETTQLAPEALACHTVRVAAFLSGGGDAAGMAWFDSWARLRASANVALAARLAEAEALCAFEFWAARAEAASCRVPVPSLLAEAFPGLHLSRLRGEVAAAEAVLSGGVT